MTVYVDELRLWPGHKPSCFRSGSCHMSADTLDELHAFAKRLGLRRAWFQEHPSMPHYDLTKGKRALAVSLGAVETTARQQAKERMSNRRVRDGGIPGARVADDDGSCFLEPPPGGWPSHGRARTALQTAGFNEGEERKRLERLILSRKAPA